MIKEFFYAAIQAFSLKNESSSGRYTRMITHSLIFSVSLNIALLVTFLYRSLTDESSGGGQLAFQEVPASPSIDSSSNLTQLKELEKKPFFHLVQLLGEVSHQANGLSLADFALAALVREHAFDLDRALGYSPTSKVRLIAGNMQSKEVEEALFFPQLSQEERERIVRFAYTEKYPFTVEGLFTLVKYKIEAKELLEPELVQAITRTDQYISFEMLLKRQVPGLRRKEAFLLLASGNFDLFSKPLSMQSQYGAFPKSQRLQWLSAYLPHQSFVAARLLLASAPHWAASQLSSQQIEEILSLTGETSAGLDVFCLDLLTSAREQNIWHRAADRLYAMKGHTPPNSFSHRKALRDLVPREYLKNRLEMMVSEGEKVEVAIEPQLSNPKPVDQVYVVEEGDSLWEISQELGIDLQILQQHNGIQGDHIWVGQKLKIPKKI